MGRLFRMTEILLFLTFVYTVGSPFMLILFLADCLEGQPGWQLSNVRDALVVAWTGEYKEDVYSG